LFDAYHVPKPLSQQILPFGRSDDGLEELTFGVEQFSALSVRGGQSACLWRTVRDLLFVVCSSCSCSPSFSIRCVFKFWLGEVSDGPRVPGGQSACSPRTVRFSGFTSGGSVGFNGQFAAQAGLSAVLVRTIRGTLADGPLGSCGRSARAWLFCFLVRFPPPSFVLPRVLQGIVPKT
jgi:hypothetical protein